MIRNILLVKLIGKRFEIQISLIIVNDAYKTAVGKMLALLSNSYHRLRWGYINYAQYNIAGFTLNLEGKFPKLFGTVQPRLNWSLRYLWFLFFQNVNYLSV